MGGGKSGKNLPSLVNSKESNTEDKINNKKYKTSYRTQGIGKHSLGTREDSKTYVQLPNPLCKMELIARTELTFTA